MAAAKLTAGDMPARPRNAAWQSTASKGRRPHSSASTTPTTRRARSPPAIEEHQVRGGSLILVNSAQLKGVISGFAKYNLEDSIDLADGHGGTLIADPPPASPTNVAPFGNYIAAGFPVPAATPCPALLAGDEALAQSLAIPGMGPRPQHALIDEACWRARPRARPFRLG